MILYCIRHGESTYNAEGRIQGQHDPPLSDLGRRQAERLAAAFAGQRIAAVYSSPLARAMETARPVAAALELKVGIVDDLKELNAGIFQGRCWAELADLHPAEAYRWSSQDPDFQIPEGESRRALMVRGKSALEGIRRGGEERVVVVTHGGLLNAALKALLDIPAARNPFSFYNASISQLGWEGQVKLLTLNQVEHLRRPDGGLDTRSGDL
jgi:probable phosphoglycerate mutase